MLFQAEHRFEALNSVRPHICVPHGSLTTPSSITSVVCLLSLAIGCFYQLDRNVGIVFKSRYHLKSCTRFEFGLYHPSRGTQPMPASEQRLCFQTPKRALGWTFDSLQPLVCLASGDALVCLARSHLLWVFDADLAVRSCPAAHPISATETGCGTRCSLWFGLIFGPIIPLKG